MHFLCISQPLGIYLFSTYSSFYEQQTSRVAQSLHGGLLILRLILYRHDFRVHQQMLCWVRGWKGWEPLTKRERTVMTLAKVGRSSTIGCLVSIKSVRSENSPSNRWWVTLLCWEIREPWSLIGCNAARREEKVIPAVPGMWWWRGVGQNKIKEKKISFCFRNNGLVEKQAVQIPSESNENKMDNNGENRKRGGLRGEKPLLPFF